MNSINALYLCLLVVDVCSQSLRNELNLDNSNSPFVSSTIQPQNHLLQMHYQNFRSDLRTNNNPSNIAQTFTTSGAVNPSSNNDDTKVETLQATQQNLLKQGVEAEHAQNDNDQMEDDNNENNNNNEQSNGNLKTTEDKRNPLEQEQAHLLDEGKKYEDAMSDSEHNGEKHDAMLDPNNNDNKITVSHRFNAAGDTEESAPKIDVEGRKKACEACKGKTPEGCVADVEKACGSLCSELQPDVTDKSIVEKITEAILGKGGEKCPKFEFSWDCLEAYAPDQAYLGFSLTHGSTTIAIHIVWDLETFEIGFFSGGGMSIGTNFMTVIDFAVEVGICYKGENSGKDLENDGYG